MSPHLLRLRTLGVAAIGIAVFELLSLPLPFLLGPMFACLLAALWGLPMKGTPVVSDAMRTVLGLAVGFSITPEAVARMPSMWASLMFIPPFIFLIGLAGYPYFRRLCGFDPATSYYAAMPGGLQDMLIFGEEAGGDARALSLIHATRVLMIVAGLPLIMSFGFGAELGSRPGAPARDLPPHEMALMVVIAALGWWGAKRIGLFGAAILGPLILAAAASLAGLVHSRPPNEAIVAAQVFIGLGIGVKYAGITLEEIRRVILAAIGYVAILAALSAAMMEAVMLASHAPILDIVLAFSPGGQAEMSILAILAGADLAFVVTHHLARIVIVILGAPLVGKRLMRRDPP